MGKQILTVAMEVEDGGEMPELVQDLFDRMREYPEARDRIGVFAASWSNVFAERDELEDKFDELRL